MSQDSSLFTINLVLIIVTKYIDIAMRMVTYLHTYTTDFVRLYMFWPKWFQKRFQSTYFSKGDMLLDPLGGALSRAQIPPSSRKEKGSGVTSQNPWASYTEAWSGQSDCRVGIY